MTVKTPTDLPDRLGRYQILKLLGRGGMGAVYLARDEQLEREVALKVPQFSSEDDSQALKRFYEEARAAATFRHPNLCPVYEVGQIDGVHYLTMAYIEGKSLSDWVRSAKPLTLRQIAFLVRKLALALQEAHQKGIIHRDLKPANIMIDKQGEPVVMDFGLARRNQSGNARLTQSGTIMGSPAYMPPEQVRGDVQAIGPGCDVYSLGVILYELLARRLPFSGDTMSVLSRVLLDEPPAPSRFRPDVDPALEAICLKAMAKKIQDRHVSMAEFAGALQDYLRGASPTTEKVAKEQVRPGRDTRTVRKSDPPATAPAPDTDPDAATLPPTLPPAKQLDIEPTLADKKRPRRARASRRRAGFPWVWVGIGTALASVALAVGIVVAIVSHKNEDAKTNARTTNPPPPPPPEFRPIFNGKDLSGWMVASGASVWRVEQGELVFHVKGPAKRGWLVTTREYADFRLRLEFQLSRGANSGVGLRLPATVGKHLKVQILDDSDPKVMDKPPTLFTGSLYDVAIDRPARLEPLGDWNRMEIELRGRALRVTVNGRETVKTALDVPEAILKLNGPPPKKGRIGLHHWAGSVWFRKIEVMELPPEGAAGK